MSYTLPLYNTEEAMFCVFYLVNIDCTVLYWGTYVYEPLFFFFFSLSFFFGGEVVTSFLQPPWLCVFFFINWQIMIFEVVVCVLFRYLYQIKLFSTFLCVRSLGPFTFTYVYSTQCVHLRLCSVRFLHLIFIHECTDSSILTELNSSSPIIDFFFVLFPFCLEEITVAPYCRYSCTIYDFNMTIHYGWKSSRRPC